MVIKHQAHDVTGRGEDSGKNEVKASFQTTEQLGTKLIRPNRKVCRKRKKC